REIEREASLRRRFRATRTSIDDVLRNRPMSEFAKLFEAQSAEAQKGHRKVRVGEMLQAVVVQIDKETIFVELDAKRQAMLDVAEMRSPDGSLDVKVGDTVRARVVSVDDQT